MICRACNSARLHLFLPLGLHPLANRFLRPDQLDAPEFLSPLDACVCLDCGLIQVRNSVPPDYFRHYVYIPSTADTMHRHFAALAGEIAVHLLRSPRALTVDIGCNDGLLLKHLKAHGARTLGIDPAANIVQAAREAGVEVINEYFAPDVAREVRRYYGPAAVVVCTNTFHHIDNLDLFTEGVKLLLDDDGVFVVEVPYALRIVEDAQFDGIYHEHVSQFTVKAFVDHFRRFGMEIFRIDELDVHGGSIRVFATRACSRMPDRVTADWLQGEHARGLFSASTYDAFRDRVERNKAALIRLLQDLKTAGTIVGYGASARANTLLNYYRIGPEILDYIVDRNPLKQGLYSPGMHIPVSPVERIFEDTPDYVLILAWNFADEIVHQLAPYREQGGRFIVPIPDPRIAA